MAVGHDLNLPRLTPGLGERAGSLETFGFKQTFWSLLGLWPKVTRAGARNGYLRFDVGLGEGSVVVP